MVTSFSGLRSRSTRREPPTMGKQLMCFITCGCKSSASFFVIYKAGCEPTLPGPLKEDQSQNILPITLCVNHFLFCFVFFSFSRYMITFWLFIRTCIIALYHLNSPSLDLKSPCLLLQVAHFLQIIFVSW